MEKKWQTVPDVEALQYKGIPEKPDIKIFVSHRIDLDSETINNPLYIPVRCGAVYDEREDVTMLGDDTGDNISEKRMSFCEFTVMYWAWKNVQADYYGLSHYRRFLSFSDKQFKPANLRQGIMDSLATEIVSACGLLDVNHMQEEICAYDVTVPNRYHMQKDWIPDSTCKTLREQWEKYCPSYLQPGHFDLLLSLIKTFSPEFYDDAVQYMNGKYFYGFNCFVMKKEYFESLCNFLFPILFEFDATIDKSNFSSTQNRAVGYAGEWLFSIWIYHTYKNRSVKIKERQLLAFQNTEKKSTLTPAYHDNNIVVAFVVTDANRPLLSVSFKSILRNISPENNYDFIFLQRSYDEDKWGTFLRKSENKLLTQMAADYKNVSVRFFDPKDHIGSIELHEYGTISKEEQYYSILMPWILESYDKVLILNEWTLFNHDIAELYHTDISNHYIAGIKDVFFSSMLNGMDTKFRKKCAKLLQMDNPYNYIATNILVTNLKSIRENFNRDDILALIEQKQFINISGDAINTLYESHIKFLSETWSKLQCLDANYFRMLEFIPEDLMNEINRVKEPYGISLRSLSGFSIPAQTDAGQLFWSLAKETPFYDQILSQLYSAYGQAITDIQYRLGIFDTRSGARKLADKLLPKGTYRRNFIKFLIPKGSIRWRFCKQIYYIFRPQYRPIKDEN